MTETRIIVEAGGIDMYVADPIVRNVSRHQAKARADNDPICTTVLSAPYGAFNDDDAARLVANDIEDVREYAFGMIDAAQQAGADLQERLDAFGIDPDDNTLYPAAERLAEQLAETELAPVMAAVRALIGRGYTVERAGTAIPTTQLPPVTHPETEAAA